jgi:hypothetical protein
LVRHLQQDLFRTHGSNLPEFLAKSQPGLVLATARNLKPCPRLSDLVEVTTEVAKYPIPHW